MWRKMLKKGDLYIREFYSPVLLYLICYHTMSRFLHFQLTSVFWGEFFFFFFFLGGGGISAAFLPSYH